MLVVPRCGVGLGISVLRHGVHRAVQIQRLAAFDRLSRTRGPIGRGRGENHGTEQFAIVYILGRDFGTACVETIAGVRVRHLLLSFTSGAPRRLADLIGDPTSRGCPS
jgi:hypothetical protein